MDLEASRHGNTFSYLFTPESHAGRFTQVSFSESTILPFPYTLSIYNVIIAYATFKISQALKQVISRRVISIFNKI